MCNALVVTQSIWLWKVLNHKRPVMKFRFSAKFFFSMLNCYYLSHYFVCMNIVTANQVAHVNCGNCKMLLRYPYGARSVKCAVCSFVTLVGVSTISSLVNTLQCVTDSKVLFFIRANVCLAT